MATSSSLPAAAPLAWDSLGDAGCSRASCGSAGKITQEILITSKELEEDVLLKHEPDPPALLVNEGNGRTCQEEVGGLHPYPRHSISLSSPPQMPRPSRISSSILGNFFVAWE